jgi:signal recognition particle receptor subunit beta
LKNITEPQNLKGIIFLVDSASLSAGDEGLRQSAEYLHDILLLLQKRATKTTSKAPQKMPLLIAANKMDLFAAVPAAMVKNVLEKEITKVRKSKSRALLDSGIGMGEAAEDNDDWLGEMGSTDFRFEQLAEFEISVEIAGGSALGSGNVATEKWWSWIADRL